MRNKLLLFCCFLGFSITLPSFSQVTPGNFSTRFVSPDSLRNFDENSFRINALREGYIGREFDIALYQAKRQHIIDVYYPNAYDIQNYKLPPNVGMFAPPCVNEGFEMGNFTGWITTMGTNTNSCAYPTATVPLGMGPTLTVLTTPLIDPVTGVLVPNSPLGGSMVAKMNNTSVGGKVIKMTQNFLVTNSNYLYDFAYYAVQNGPHTCCQQPYMFVRLRDCVNNLLSCPNFTFNAPATNSNLCPGTGPTNWINTGVCPGGQCIWRTNGWQKYSMDLTQYIGTCVTVEVMVADCSPTGHYLYTYFDSNCNTMNLIVNGTNTVSMPSQTVTPQVLCGTTATLTAPGGLNPYLWNGPPLSGVTNNTNQTISTSVAGNYTLQMTPTGVCNPIFRIVNLQFVPPATVTMNPIGGVCPGINATLTASGATNYTWMPGGSNSASIVVSPTVTTIYTLTANTGTCTGSQTIQVNVNPSPTVNIAASSLSVCAGMPSTLTASGANTYSWSTGGIGSSIVVTPTTTSVYTVVGTSTTGCQGTSTVMIFVVPTPTSFVTVASPTLICIGGNSNLFASALGASSYTWFPGALVGNFVNVTPTITTQYTVIAANGSCTNSAVLTVSVDPGPTMTVVANPTAICPGGSATLTASGAASYTWMPMVTVSSSVIVSPTISTTYTVLGTSGFGCPGTKTITQVVSPVPNLTMTPASPTICIGTSATLTASGAGSYTWLPGGLTTTSISVSPTVNTTYTIIGSNGTCTSSITRTVTVVPIPTVGASASSSSICAGQTATLTGSGALSYTWNPGALSGATVAVSPLVTTNYTVIGASGGCTSTALVSLTVNTGPTITANSSPTAICAGSSATLSANGALSYTWNPGALSGSSITVSPGSTTNYSVTGNNIFGCTTTQTLNLIVNPNPTVTANANPTAICNGGSATLTANGATSYTWNPGALTGSNVVVSPSVTTTYTISGLSLGCSGQNTLSLIVIPTPTVSASVSPTSICNGASATLTANGAINYTWNPGALTGSNVVVTPTSNTTYTVVGSNGACSANATVALVVNPTPTITANASPTAICVSGNVTLTANGASTYTWNPGALTGSNVVVSPLVTTSYSVTGTSGFGCTGTAVVVVTVNAVPSLTVTASPTAICNGATSTLNASGAVSYTWNPGGLTGSSVAVSPTVTTIYTVNASNGGCSTTGTISLIVNPLPTITAVANPTGICSGSSSTLTANGGLSYTWNPGGLNGTTISVTPSVTTNYSVTGINAFGCTRTATVTLSVTPTPTINATANPTAICVGSNATLTANGATTYTWNPGILTGSSVVVSPTVTTLYTVTGSNGVCNGTRTLNLIVNPVPSLTVVGSPNPSCAGSVVSMTVSGANVYNWLNPPGISATVVAVAPNVSTTYSVTGTSLAGCTSTAILNVTVFPNPTVTIVSTNTNICSGSSATLTAFGANNYTWNPGGTNGSTLVVTPSVTTTYTVVGTNIFGCANTRTFTQVVTPTPTVNASASPTTICSGNSSTLIANGALSYTWNPGGLSGATVVVTPTSTTIYTVIGANGNCTATRTLNLIVNPTPTLTALASPTVICAGSTTTLSVIGASNYTWNPGALTGNTLAVSPTITTQYTVNGQTLAGCSASAIVNVSVNAVPVLSITASATNICIGSSGTLSASGASSYTWNPGAIIGSSIVITPTSNVVYTVTGQVPGGCTSSAQITINANPGPTVTASASPTVICAGQSATLTGNGATSYTWFPGGLTGTTIVVTPSVNTNYTVNGSNGSCISSGLVSMSVIPGPTINANANPTLICNGGTTTLTATGGIVYAWLPPALAGSMIVQSPTVTTTYTVIGSNGSCTNTAMVTVSVNSGPSVSITATPTSICIGNTTTLTASGASNYTWQPGGSNATTIAVSPTTTTSYTLFGNSGSCTGSVAITITVNANPTITAGANPTVVCAGSLITLTVSGANSYSWNPIGVTGATVTDSPTITTIYTVTGTSLAGCSNTANVTVSVNALPTITATPSPTSICQGSSATITAIGATNYTWNPGALNGSSIVVSPTITTTYTINGQDLLGCVGNKTVQLVVFPTTPTISPVSNPTAICAGSSATLTVTGATSYTWNPGALTGSNIVVSPSITTTYTVDGSNGICGGASSTITLVVNDLPANVTASVSSIITCATPSVNLFGTTTSTNVSYLWNGPGAYTSAVQNPTGIAVPGIYTLTVFNNPGGCSTSATVAVLTDSNIPTATITINGTITCANPTATLIASATPTNVNYNWSGPSSFTSALQSPTITLGGTYTLTVIDPNNNCQASTVFIVTTNTTVPISATIVPATCSGTMANNDAMIIVSGFIPTDHYDFVAGATYTGIATYTSAPAIPLTGILTNTLNNPLAPMPYTVRFFGANGCTKDTTLILLPTSCITNTVFGLAKAVSSPSLQTNGSYNVTYTVVVKNTGLADLNDISLIENLSLTFPLPTTFSITAPPLITSLNSSLTLDPSFNGTLQTVMTQSASSKLKAGKSDTIVFSLNIIPNGIFGPFNNSVIGYASPTTGVVFGDSSNTGYDPDPDLNGNPTDNDLPTVLNLPPNLFFGLTKVGTLGEKQDNGSYDISYAVTVHNLGNDTLYSVTVKDSLFNNTIRQPATYVMKNGPFVSGSGSLAVNSSYNGNSDVNLIIPSQSKMPPGTTGTISFTINVNPDTVTVIKNSATGQAMNSASTIVTDISNDGTNPDSNNNGVWNEDADNVPTVLLIPNNGTLFIPNGFTPNDDNKNDVWFIKGLPKDTKVTIYNRWGNKVYSKDNYDNTWNGYPNVSGTLGSQKLSQGTYYYIVEFKDSALKPQNGFVVIQY